MNNESKIMVVASGLCILVFAFAVIRASFLLDEVIGWLAVAAIAMWWGHAASSVVKDLRKEREAARTKGAAS